MRKMRDPQELRHDATAPPGISARCGNGQSPRRWSRWAWGLVAVAFAAAALVWAWQVGFVPRPPGAALPPGDALSSLVVENGVYNSWSIDLKTGWVAIATFDHLAVDEEIVIEQVRPTHIETGLEVLDARVYPDALGFYCTTRWPPAGFGALVSAEGLAVGPGDFIAVMLFVRVNEPGTRTADGLTFVYKQGRRRFQQTTEAFTLEVVGHERAPHANCNSDDRILRPLPEEGG